MPDALVMQQLEAVIDGRTTMVCLRAAGQVQPVGHPFTTLLGEQAAPPFHSHCRTIVRVWMPGFVSDQKSVANAEIMRRPYKQRRFGPDGYEGSLPPKVSGPPALPAASMDDMADDALVKIADMRGTTLAPAKARERFAGDSGFRASFAEAVDKWTGSKISIGDLRDNPDSAASVALQKMLDRAGPTDVDLYRGMAFQSMRDVSTWKSVKVGDTLPNRLASSFTSNESHARFFEGQGLSAAEAKDMGIETDLPFLSWSGVRMRLQQGARAVDIGPLSNTRKEAEWLVGRDLQVVSIKEVGFEAWEVVVTTV